MSASALVLVGAAATILAALAFEHLGGYAPCPLCLEERYAYYFAVPASARLISLRTRIFGYPRAGKLAQKYLRPVILRN